MGVWVSFPPSGQALVQGLSMAALACRGVDGGHSWCGQQAP